MVDSLLCLVRVGWLRDRNSVCVCVCCRSRSLPVFITWAVAVRLNGGCARHVPSSRAWRRFPAVGIGWTSFITGGASASFSSSFAAAASFGPSHIARFTIAQTLGAAQTAALPHQVTQSVGHHLLRPVDAEGVFVLPTESHFALPTWWAQRVSTSTLLHVGHTQPSFRFPPNFHFVFNRHHVKDIEIGFSTNFSKKKPTANM